ncbi:MAG: histidine kinase [Chloroflexi bacterium]|nr:histidine kinase [Chloroflexota bacterium]
MFSTLRLRLTLLYLGAAAALLVLLGAGMYWLIAEYFRTTTDAALEYKMAFEFRQLGAPMPSTLPVAARSLAQQALTEPALAAQSSELAAIYVLPLDRTGRALFNPNTFALPSQPDPAAASEALRQGFDRRTLVLADGSRVRVLTYRLTREDGPALIQVGRTLRGQDEALQRLLLGLVAIACGGAALLGWSSWWLAGRSLRPAEEAWERQQAFIANASHEIRAPLTLLRASAEVARLSYESDATQRELLDDVVDEADHMTQLVEDLLLLSRLDAQRVTVERTPLPIAPLLGDLQRQLGRVANERGITLQVTQANGTILGDAAKLRQVLLIVVDNALRHTPAGGAVRLSAQPRGKSIELAVADNGEGIAPEHLPHLFERFYRVDSSRGQEQHGSGLGLSIAKALIEAQDGRISIVSQVKAGTTVTLRLPAAGDRYSL